MFSTMLFVSLDSNLFVDDEFLAARTGNGSVTSLDSSTASSAQLPPIMAADIGERFLTALRMRGHVRVPLYAIIFILAVLGNALVIVTLAQNRTMRTVTNLFLLNLSVSDLLLAVLCMPFTLIPTLLQDFIFGAAVCVLIRYMQGVSVGVSVFTLVTISMERYFAICRPLTSLTWQTRRHAYKTICLVWFVALLVMVPTAVSHQLLPMPNGAHKCVEIWTDSTLDKVHTIFLDVILLVLPLFLMIVAYAHIAVTLFAGFRRLNDGRTSHQTMSSALGDNGNRAVSSSSAESTVSCSKPWSKGRLCLGGKNKSDAPPDLRSSSRALDAPTVTSRRHSSYGVSGCSNNASRMRAKKRSVQMLSAVVLEFFVCWTPMYVMQTWLVFDYQGAVERVSGTTMNYIHLVAFISSCCNPVTYCFMSAKFRQCFCAAFRRCFCCRPRTAGSGGLGIYAGASTTASLHGVVSTTAVPRRSNGCRKTNGWSNDVGSSGSDVALRRGLLCSSARCCQRRWK